MSTAIRTRRKNMFNVLREAQKLESFDEFPMLRPEVDPQVHASRNSVDQPFLLVCEKDCVLAQISGSSRVEFPEGPVRHFEMEPGDFVYVPGGSAHRLLITKPGVQIRYKARIPGHESVLWLCESCGLELDRYEMDPGEMIPAQQGYADATRRFNAEPLRRTCAKCGHEHAELDLAPFRWTAIAEYLTMPEEDEESAVPAA